MAPRCALLASVLHIFILVSEGAKQILCDNAGLEYSIFRNPYEASSADRNYVNYNPNYMKDPSVGGTGTQNLLGSGYVTGVGGWAGLLCSGNFSSNGISRIPCEKSSLMLRGYIHAQMSGVYSFVASEIDEALFLWVGSPAQTGWNRRNTIMESTLYNQWYTPRTVPGGSNVTFIQLNQGSYYPLRLIHAQWTNATSLRFTILDPLGTPILGAQTGESVNIIRYSCDGNYYYPNAFGREA